MVQTFQNIFHQRFCSLKRLSYLHKLVEKQIASWDVKPKFTFCLA